MEGADIRGGARGEWREAMERGEGSPPRTMCVPGTLARALAPTRHNVTVHATLAHAARANGCRGHARAPAPTEPPSAMRGSFSFKFPTLFAGLVFRARTNTKYHKKTPQRVRGGHG